MLVMLVMYTNLRPKTLRDLVTFKFTTPSNFGVARLPRDAFTPRDRVTASKSANCAPGQVHLSSTSSRREHCYTPWTLHIFQFTLPLQCGIIQLLKFF